MSPPLTRFRHPRISSQGQLFDVSASVSVDRRDPRPWTTSEMTLQPHISNYLVIIIESRMFPLHSLSAPACLILQAYLWPGKPGSGANGNDMYFLPSYRTGQDIRVALGSVHDSIPTSDNLRSQCGRDWHSCCPIRWSPARGIVGPWTSLYRLGSRQWLLLLWLLVYQVVHSLGRRRGASSRCPERRGMQTANTDAT